MKERLLLALLLLQLHANAQSVNEDSLDCIRRTKALAAQIAEEGDSAKYFIDSNWVVYLSPANAPVKPNTLQLVNVGGAKQFSVSLTGFKLTYIDNKGKKGVTEINRPIELIKHSELFHCGSGSLDLNSIQAPNTTNNHIQYVRLHIQWQNGETVAILGRQVGSK